MQIYKDGNVLFSRQAGTVRTHVQLRWEGEGGDVERLRTTYHMDPRYTQTVWPRLALVDIST